MSDCISNESCNVSCIKISEICWNNLLTPLKTKYNFKLLRMPSAQTRMQKMTLNGDSWVWVAQAFVLFPVETMVLGFLLWSAYCSHIHCRAECQSVSGCTQHRPANMLMQKDGDWLLNCCLCIHHSTKWRIRAKCYLLGFCPEVKMFTLTGFK